MVWGAGGGLGYSGHVDVLTGGIFGHVAFCLLIGVFNDDTIVEWIVGGEPHLYGCCRRVPWSEQLCEGSW